MRSKSLAGASASDIKIALDQSLTDGFAPTLAMLFISVTQDRNAVCEILSSHQIDIIGATSAGEFINGHQSHGQIAILLLDLKKEYYSILFRPTNSPDIARTAKECAVTALSVFKNPAFIICSTCISQSGQMFEGEKFVHCLEEHASSNAAIFGAMSGDDGSFTGSFVFNGHESTDEGVAILVLDNSKVDLYGMAISGWKPLGKIRTVTKCENGWLSTIDHQPALDMYLRYLGQSLKTGKVAVAGDIGMYYPFLAIDAGEPALRTAMEVDKEKGSIKLDFPIPEGKQFHFTVPPDFDIVETVLESATELKEERGATADALLIFSCLGRLAALGPMVEEENEGLQKIWNAPMAGFFSYGEYGKNKGSLHVFHSTTCSWVAIKEKEEG